MLDVVRDPAAADGQATGQPVTVVDLGEKRLGSKLPEKSDIPISLRDSFYRQLSSPFAVQKRGLSA